MADLIVRRVGTQEEVGRVQITNLNRRSVERVIGGMTINMREGCYVDDSEVEAAIVAREEAAGAGVQQGQSHLHGE